MVAAVVAAIVVLALLYAPGSPLAVNSSTTAPFQKLPSATLSMPGAGTITEQDVGVTATVASNWTGSVNLVMSSPISFSVCAAFFAQYSLWNYTDCNDAQSTAVYDVTLYDNCLAPPAEGANHLFLSVIAPSGQSGLAVDWHVYYNATAPAGCGSASPIDYQSSGSLHPYTQALLTQYPDEFALPAQYSNVEIWINSSSATSIYAYPQIAATQFADNDSTVFEYSGTTTFDFEIEYYAVAPFSASVQALVY